MKTHITLIKLTKIILTLYLVSVVYLVPVVLLAQSEEEIQLQIIELREKIKQLQQDNREEKKYFEAYEKEKTIILEAKHEDQKKLKSEIVQRQKKIQKSKRELDQTKFKIDEIIQRNQEINQFIRLVINQLMTEIERGIPYEKQKRKFVLSSLLIDLKTTSIFPGESFNRLFNFLNQEEALGYDSQVLRTIISSKGIQQKVNLIRIGRVIFAAQSGESIFLFKKVNQKYLLEKKELSILQAREIKKAAEIIQGKRPPELVKINLKLAHSDILKNQRTSK